MRLRLICLPCVLCCSAVLCERCVGWMDLITQRRKRVWTIAPRSPSTASPGMYALEQQGGIIRRVLREGEGSATTADYGGEERKGKQKTAKARRQTPSNRMRDCERGATLHRTTTADKSFVLIWGCSRDGLADQEQGPGLSSPAGEGDWGDWGMPSFCLFARDPEQGLK